MERFLTFVCISIALLGGSQVIAQGPGFDVPKIETLVKVPPSPEAQAFTKYGNSAVNLYTGTPDVSIPIANLQGREINVPITLTYDASGIKVEQIATWVGLGWNLNVGGMVTRQVNGNPDDYISANPSLKPFYSSEIASEYNFVNGFTPAENITTAAGNLQRYFAFLNNVTRADIMGYKYEIQPDTYSFNAMGVSGTLYIDYSQAVAYCMEHPEIKAYPTFNTVGNIKNITAWKIIDGNGNAYYFDLAERTYTYEQGATDVFKDYNSAWMLTKVESTNKRDIVQFNYSSPVMWNQPQLAGRGDMRNDKYQEGTFCGNDDQILAPVPLYKIYQSELTSIQMNGTLVAQFIPSTIERKDLKSRKFLANIKIIGDASAAMKRFKFVRSYFGDSTQTDEKLIRLRLDALEVFGDQTTTVPERYSFTYESGSLPSRESYAQDFWGYYNGKSYNQTLIPKNYYYDTENVNFAGADRSPDFDFGKIGSLIKIKYPTGGTTEFGFRPHMSAGPVHSVTSLSVPGAASLTGGRDDNDPFGYIACDDNTNIPPRGVTNYFYISTAQTLKVSMISVGESSPGLQMVYAAIYKVPGNGQRATNPPFCEVLNGSLPKIFQHYGPLAPGNYDYGPRTFEPGHYRIMLLNTNPKLTVSIFATGTTTVGFNEIGGQRVTSIVDKDDNGKEISARYFYYGDLSSILPANINRTFIVNSTPSGHLHASIDFEESKSTRRFNPTYGFSTCSSIMRYSNNRTKASQHVTYPVVTEVQFGSPSKSTFNGYTVTTFWDEGNTYVIGYSKRSILDGRVKQKVSYNSSGDKLTEEKTYYSQASVGGQVGFELIAGPGTGKDTYVLDEQYNQGNDEHYILRDPTIVGVGAGQYPTHCAWSGAASYYFSDANYHTCGKLHIGYSCSVNGTCQTIDTDFTGSHTVNQNHPAYQFYQSLTGKSPVIEHHNRTGLVGVYYQKYDVIYCKSFSTEYTKLPYLFPRYLARTDSVITITYNGGNSLVTAVKNSYNTSSHYQITATEAKDSKSEVRKWLNYYPHDLVVSNPTDPAWQALIDQNRIAGPVKIEAKYGSPLQSDYTKLTKFKTITATNGNMIVPDVIQFSSGSGAMEDRIKFHQYDNAGNAIELSKINDSRNAYIWGYSQSLPVAEVKGANADQIAYTSFEEGSSQGGWTFVSGASLTEYKTGAKGHILSSNSVTRSGLTASSTYILSYWAKGGTPTLTSGVQSSNDGATESDGWKYFEKTITGVTSITLSAPSSPAMYLDELRIYPKGALMTTYTHIRGIGITSQTDPSNRISYFEYDNTGRLKLVKDHNKNITKQHLYHWRTGEVPTGTN